MPAVRAIGLPSTQMISACDALSAVASASD